MSEDEVGNYFTNFNFFDPDSEMAHVSNKILLDGTSCTKLISVCLLVFHCGFSLVVNIRSDLHCKQKTSL